MKKLKQSVNNTMFQTVLWNVSVVLVIYVFTLVKSEDCQRNEVKEGCTVDHGHAQCESWDLGRGINGLPACTTRITFSLVPGKDDNEQYETGIHLGNVSFSHILNLTELSVVTNRRYYDLFQLYGFESPALLSLESLRILQLKVRQWQMDELSQHNFDMYSTLKHLKVLDLTRAQLIGLSNIKYLLGKQLAVKTLILKNIQDISLPPTYTPVLDLAHFICGTNVRFLDLSHNDITYINMPEKYCKSEVRYINVDHNIIASFISDNGDFMSLISMLGTLQSGRASSLWKSATNNEHLWMDTNLYNKYIDNEEEDDDKKSPLSMLIQQSPLASLAVYDEQLKDIIKHCGNLNYIDLVRCFLQGHSDLCDLFQCLSPTLDIDACPRNYFRDKLEYFAQRMCHYDSCMYNVPLPFPPKLKSIILNDVGTRSKLSLGFDIHKHNFTNFCFHPDNSLEYLDVSFWDFSQMTNLHIPGLLTISGFHKLKYLNIQGCHIPLHSFKLVSPDMTSLTELHMGGNIIASDNTLPTYLLQTFTNLTLLNLSNANLLGIEADAFANHQCLSVLDLSYNHLTLSSLSVIDLSKTSIRSLNLSHNQLTTVPAPLRRQLDKMEGLDLDLSGNPFICSCENLEFLRWVQSSSSITFHYAGDHVCTDSPDNTIHNIDVDSLHCNWYWMQPLIAVASSLALTLFGIAIRIVYKKRFHISNLIFRFQERFSTAPDDNIINTYMYDAFVLYSGVDDDRLWVHYKLVTELENVYGFRLCIHHRDFRAGDAISDNIERAIRASRKVLVVMSPNFVRSDWCIEEVQIARSFDLNKLLVIMYKDVLSPDVPKPAVICHLLETRTYIEWNETPVEAQKLFWKKLRRALHSRQKVTNEESQQRDLDNQILLVPQPE